MIAHGTHPETPREDGCPDCESFTERTDRFEQITAELARSLTCHAQIVSRYGAEHPTTRSSSQALAGHLVTVCIQVMRADLAAV